MAPFRAVASFPQRLRWTSPFLCSTSMGPAAAWRLVGTAAPGPCRKSWRSGLEGVVLHDEDRMCHGLGMPTRVPSRLLMEWTIDPTVGVRSPCVLLDYSVCPWTLMSTPGWRGGDARLALLLMNRSAPVVPGGQQPVHTRRSTPCAVCRLGWCGLHPSVP